METQSFAGNSLNRSVISHKNEGFLNDLLKNFSTQIILLTLKQRQQTILCMKNN